MALSSTTITNKNIKFNNNNKQKLQTKNLQVQKYKKSFMKQQTYHWKKRRLKIICQKEDFKKVKSNGLIKFALD